MVGLKNAALAPVRTGFCDADDVEGTDSMFFVVDTCRITIWNIHSRTYLYILIMKQTIRT